MGNFKYEVLFTHQNSCIMHFVWTEASVLYVLQTCTAACSSRSHDLAAKLQQMILFIDIADFSFELFTPQDVKIVKIFTESK